ncbi:hypothetical protein [Streptomyces sp. NPDC058240]|uniref:hypothetical protein n=1 Tax=Streptomyces sp. NPDC058240 TaxID=3346396 RepID=UPI0036E21D17
MDELKSSGKPFEISKRAVWEAYKKVKANKGAPGVDGVSIEEFEMDLKGNLYKIWNRMSSGSYFPPPVQAVEIAKAHGGGTRILGVPTVGDRIAQTVVAQVLEQKVEPIFRAAADTACTRPGLDMDRISFTVLQTTAADTVTTARAVTGIVHRGRETAHGTSAVRKATGINGACKKRPRGPRSTRSSPRSTPRTTAM